jgi:protein tyrosine/serine phosphatase
MITYVNDGVYRGPRPDVLNYASTRLKFPYVVSLEGEKENELERAALAPTKVLSETITPFEIYFKGITPARLIEIVNLIRQLQKPVLVHCQHGEDRTGLVIAAYRVLAQGWTKEQAMSEALEFHYRRLINFGLNKTWSEFQG